MTAAGTAKRAPESSDHHDYAVLREYGYSDEDIGNLSASPRALAREVQDALEHNIDPAKAMQTYKLPEAFSRPTGEQPDQADAAGYPEAKPATGSAAEERHPQQSDQGKPDRRSLQQRRD